ncbi:site-specific DNA-methyltransferase [Mesorhizobium sp. M0999]|uniref:DNA methyltransferase n=1 Tax=Mesorhizobium sp. M0999 TaxID=2957045 RepID=UPI00333B1330
MTNHELHRQLSLVDWDFIERASLDISAIHWYPGSFAPGLPGVLVDLLSAPGETVFDPFCGIGSTAVASILRGRNSVSCDISPVGVMSGLATTGLISLLLSNQTLFEQVFDDLHAMIEEIHTPNVLLRHSTRSGEAVDEHLIRFGGSSVDNVFARLFKPIAIESLRKWYHPLTLMDLQRLIEQLEAASFSRFCKIVGFTMISAIARNTSSETRSWGHVADNVRPSEYTYKDVAKSALLWIQRTKKQISGVRGSLSRMPSGQTFDFSIVDWTDEQPNFIKTPATLLLTSPPYGGAIDYGLAQRLTMYLMGTSEDDLARMVGAEIGARRKRSRPTHIEVWAKELVGAAGAQLKWVTSDGYAVFVMPHKDHGRDAGELMLKAVLAAKGWELAFSADRSVRQSRTRQSWTSIKKETILVFRGGK